MNQCEIDGQTCLIGITLISGYFVVPMFNMDTNCPTKDLKSENYAGAMTLDDGRDCHVYWGELIEHPDCYALVACLVDGVGFMQIGFDWFVDSRKYLFQKYVVERRVF